MRAARRPSKDDPAVEVQAGGWERGNAAVELALLLPLLVTLSLGAIDFGRLFVTHIALVNAAHQAALYATRPNGAGASSATLMQVVASESGGTLTSANTTLTGPTQVSGTTTVQLVQVTLRTTFRPVAPLPIAGALTLTARAVAPMDVY